MMVGAMLRPQTWIVCALTGRWSAAFRVAFRRRPGQLVPRLSNVQSISELRDRLKKHPSSLGLIEVSEANLAEMLQLLTDAKQARQHDRLVALLDHSLSSGERAATTASSGSAGALAIDALWEAGAAEVVESPRRLNGLLTFCERVAATTSGAAEHAAAGQPVADWAWSLLPWQGERRTLA